MLYSFFVSLFLSFFFQHKFETGPSSSNRNIFWKSDTRGSGTEDSLTLVGRSSLIVQVQGQFQVSLFTYLRVGLLSFSGRGMIISKHGGGS